MSTTIQYKGNTLATVSNNTKTLKTAGKYMEGDVVLTDVSGGSEAISVVDTLDTNGGTIRTITAVDISDTTAQASDVAQGKYFYTADGTKTAGTSTGGGGGSTLLYSGEVTASTSSTSSTLLQTVSTNVLLRDYEKTLLYLKIRDKAGKRNGYFYGNDHMFIIPSLPFANSTIISSICYGVNSSGVYSSSNSVRGVYCARFYGSGEIEIYTRYDANRGTIDGTYTIKLYAVDCGGLE